MLYESVLRRLLNESKLDSRASLISRDVIEELKRNLDKINSTESKVMSPTVKVMVKDYEFSIPARKSEPDQMDIVVKVELKVIKQPKDGVQSNAGFGGKVPTLRITLAVLSTTGELKLQHFSNIQENMYEAVRHELEHSIQDRTDISSVEAFHKMMDQKKSLVAFKKYYMNRKELPAFVAGTYNQAKKLRKPFIDMVDVMLRKAAYQPLSAGVKPDKVQEAVEEIKSAWIEYAKVRFPEAIVVSSTTQDPLAPPQ